MQTMLVPSQDCKTVIESCNVLIVERMRKKEIFNSVDAPCN